MAVLITYYYEENPIKNEGARVLTRLYSDFSDAQGAGYSAVLGRIELKFELIQAFIIVLVTCRMMKIQLKMKAIEC